MRGVPVMAVNPRDASRLLRFLVDPPNDGINAVRRMLDRTIIDPVRCAEGLDLLRNYKYEWQELSAYGRRIPGMTLRPIAQTLYVVSLPATIRMRRGSAPGAHIHNR